MSIQFLWYEAPNGVMDLLWVVPLMQIPMKVHNRLYGGSMHILSERLGDVDGIDFIAPTAKNMRRPPEHILDQRRTVSQT